MLYAYPDSPAAKEFLEKHSQELPVEWQQYNLQQGFQSSASTYGPTTATEDESPAAASDDVHTRVDLGSEIEGNDPDVRENLISQ